MNERLKKEIESGKEVAIKYNGYTIIMFIGTGGIHGDIYEGEHSLEEIETVEEENEFFTSIDGGICETENVNDALEFFTSTVDEHIKIKG